ncbi:MAG: MBOAT family protein [Lachnospiraceae bacterium]|nr:MBOAT family protein [Lachnospiraceae bacterium]MBQ9233327.1 MBOAT family protein [Lachnospiraceae bacterium]
MSFFNPVFAFVFIPLVVIVYNIFPKKLRAVVLLAISLLFFAFVSKWLILYLILSILSIYLSGLGMNAIEEKKKETLKNIPKEEKKVVKESYKKKKKLVLVLCIIFNVAFLFMFKYFNFFAVNVNLLLDYFKIGRQITIVKHLAPIGISFYTLEALSYVLDIYYGKIEADKNIIRLALYVAFFPQLLEGPIARYQDTANALYEGNKVTYESFVLGYQRILFGFAKKLIIADRLNIIVKEVFDDFNSYNGLTVFVGVMSYMIMLYMEFAGTIDIVIGIGEMFGVKIPENFRQPFFAKNVSDFWTRWHISLGLWFKDYIFYPVSLSKSMKNLTSKAKKKLGNHYGPLVSGTVALLAVWLLNGLWHGAGWHYIFFGLYHFFMILMGNIFEPSVAKVCDRLKIDRHKKGYRIFQSVKMSVLVFIGELFFRAPSLSVAFVMLGRMFNFGAFRAREFLTIDIDIQDTVVLIAGLIGIFIIGLIREKGIDIRDNISRKKLWVRWVIYYALILLILIFGAYGQGYVPVDPIYADF